jgi:endonuclease V-like protein UPF0215 family
MQTGKRKKPQKIRAEKIKPEIRIIGWDDTPHTKNTKYVRMVGVIFRGGSFIDGLLSARIKKDGMDVTEKLIRTIKNSRHYQQLSIIMLDGITFGGFNLVNVKQLYEATRLPVIIVQRKKPDIRTFRETLKIFPDWQKRLAVAKCAGRLVKWSRNGKVLWYQSIGINKDACEKILGLTTIRGNIPEPIRVAHLIAGGLEGESRGRA